jgi:hypothetical protein
MPRINGSFLGKLGDTSFFSASGIFSIREIHLKANLTIPKWPNYNSLYGWVAGGQSPARISNVERFSHTDDTTQSSLRSPLVAARSDFGSTNNETYAWFGAGRAPALSSSVERLSFNDDLILPTIRGTVSQARSVLTATGNNNYGWFIGGTSTDASGGAVCTVDRIDYADDTAVALLRGPLSLRRVQLSALTNNNFGWAIGGIITAAFSTVDRIDFADDTATASVRGPISTVRRGHASSGNLDYGWVGGSTPASTLVTRIDYADDTSISLNRGNLNEGKGFLTSTSNKDFAWFIGGGLVPGVPFTTTIERLDFADDTTLSSIRGPLNIQKGSAGAVSGLQF